MDEPRKLRAPDAARRMRDTLWTHLTVLSRDEIMAGRFIAVRLADGGSDNTVYDSFDACWRAQRNSPSRHAYFRLPLTIWSLATCDTLLWYQRAMYESGFREDPAHQLYISNQVENLAVRAGRRNSL